ncbi:MAG: amidohydrolase family protein [Oscillospiraceae bacterium]|nr:amidohydrolase family protein [Oscillospiraceae bacterium]
MLIDFHIHVFPDALAPKVIPKLAAISGYDNQTNGTLASTLEKMQEWGVDKGVFLSIATKPSQQHSINDFCVSIASDTVIPFGSVHPDAPDWEPELERIAALGLKGIKLHPDYQGFDMGERRLLPIFQKARDLGLCVVVHAGFDPLSPEHIHCKPKDCRQVLDACPGLKLILAHMGGMRLWDDVEQYLVGAPVWLDTACCAGAIDPGQLLRIIQKHGAQKILFASDCPWSDPRREKAMIEALELPQRERDAIFFGNACRLLEL